MKRNSINPFSLASGNFDDFVRDFFEDTWLRNGWNYLDTHRPAQCRREEDKLVLELDVPGVKKEEIQIYLQEGRLNVAWTKKGQKFAHSEYVGDVVDPTAKVEDGILTVTLRVPAAQKIEVRVD
jgi:HSP20 family molecular chaperone IbpA